METKEAASALQALRTPSVAPVIELETVSIDEPARKKPCGRPVGVNEVRRHNAIHELYVCMYVCMYV